VHCLEPLTLPATFVALQKSEHPALFGYFVKPYPQIFSLFSTLFFALPHRKINSCIDLRTAA
jgi:hypothetical protein